MLPAGPRLVANAPTIILEVGLYKLIALTPCLITVPVSTFPRSLLQPMPHFLIFCRSPAKKCRRAAYQMGAHLWDPSRARACENAWAGITCFARKQVILLVPRYHFPEVILCQLRLFPPRKLVGTWFFLQVFFPAPARRCSWPAWVPDS